VILLEAAIQTAGDVALDEGIEALGGPEATWKTHATSFALNLIPVAGEVNTARKGIRLAETAIDIKKANNAAKVENITKTVNKIDTANDVKKSSETVFGYVGVDYEGIVRYTGISNDPTRRWGEHFRSIGTGKENLRYMVPDGAAFSNRSTAKVWEQNMINNFGLGKNGGQLYNKINSIGPSKWDRYGIK